MTEAGTLDEAGLVAGFASRAAAMVIDVIVIASTFYGGLALGGLTLEVLRFHQPALTAIPGPLASALLGGWTCLYFWVAWWAVGKTVGKALLGLRVVDRRGSPMSWSRSLARLGGYAVSVASLGVGFLWVALDRRRRGWHDMLARTKVVYDWHAHGATIGERPPRSATRG